MDKRNPLDDKYYGHFVSFEKRILKNVFPKI